VLTDGQDWQFFLPAGQGDYGERRVYKLDIVERDVNEATMRLERYLRYESVCSGNAVKAAQADYKDVARKRQIEASLPDAWQELVDKEDEQLVELMSDRVENLCGYKPDPDTVAAFLRNRVCLRTGPKTVGPPTEIKKPRVGGPSAPPIELGAMGFRLKGQFYPARSGKDVLVQAFRKLASQDPTFLERFAALPRHGKTRRYLARSKERLYPGRPDLIRDFSFDLGEGWWLGTNLSRKGIARILEMASQVAGLKYEVDFVAALGM